MNKPPVNMDPQQLTSAVRLIARVLHGKVLADEHAKHFTRFFSHDELELLRVLGDPNDMERDDAYEDGDEKIGNGDGDRGDEYGRTTRD